MNKQLKNKRKYIRVKDRRQGLEPSQRTIDKFEKNANQWTITPRQIMFAELYFDTTSQTFADAYKSAILAGFSESYAKRITADSMNIEWVEEARKRLVNFKPNHIVKQLENMALHAKKDADKLRALELMARVNGMFIDRSINTNIDVKFTNDIPRPTIDATYSVEPGKQYK